MNAITIGGASALGMSLITSSISPILTVGILAAWASNTYLLAEEKITDEWAEYVADIQWYLKLSAQAAAILGVFFVARYIRNMYRRDRSLLSRESVNTDNVTA